MSRTKKQDDETWGYYGKPPRENGRTPAQLAELARATRLRTLWDMSEREIRALERFYGCPVIRPQRPARGRAPGRPGRGSEGQIPTGIRRISGLKLPRYSKIGLN